MDSLDTIILGIMFGSFATFGVVRGVLSWFNKLDTFTIAGNRTFRLRIMALFRLKL